MRRRPSGAATVFLPPRVPLLVLLRGPRRLAKGMGMQHACVLSSGSYQEAELPLARPRGLDEGYGHEVRLCLEKRRLPGGAALGAAAGPAAGPAGEAGASGVLGEAAAAAGAAGRHAPLWGADAPLWGADVPLWGAYTHPLAEAEGATARRALKLFGGAACGDEAATTAGAACGRLPGMAAAASVAAALGQPLEAASELHADAEPALGPSPLARLQPYMGHAVAYVGRSLWCLNCFEVPRSAHRSWRHGRCGGVRPPSTMPPALRDSVVRQPAACSGLQAGTRARWAVLAGALRLQ